MFIYNHNYLLQKLQLMASHFPLINVHSWRRLLLSEFEMVRMRPRGIVSRQAFKLVPPCFKLFVFCGQLQPSLGRTW